MKVNEPAMGPDTTLRLDRLLGDQVTTDGIFSASEGSVAGGRTAAVGLVAYFSFLHTPSVGYAAPTLVSASLVNVCVFSRAGIIPAWMLHCY